MGLIHIEPVTSARTDTLKCLVKRRVTKRNVKNFLHWCAGLCSNGTKYVYFQRRKDGLSWLLFQKLWAGPLLGVTMSGLMDEERRAQLMSSGLRPGKFSAPETDALRLALLSHMAENGKLQPRFSGKGEVIIGYSEQLRPEVQTWAAVLFFCLLIGLMSLSIFGKCTATRILPIGGLTGETNILRRWAFENSDGSKAFRSGKT